MMSGRSWPELKTVKEENKHELVIGACYSKVIEDNGIDPFLFSLVNLNYLSINETCLESVPEDIGKLTNLTSLILYSNKLCKLPSSIGKLTKLKILDLSRNKIESIPEEIKELCQLSTLNFGTNLLTKIPSLEKNTKLAILDLSHNQFEEFPDVCHAELTHLSELKLNGNKIKEIPATINRLSVLKVMDLSDNLVAVVPGEVSDLTKMKDINLKGNKLNDKRLLKLVEQCHTKQVLDYIRQNCPRISADTSQGAKGKKGKKGKKIDTAENSNNVVEEIEQLCHKMEVVHVSESTPSVKIIDIVKSIRPFIVCCIVRNLKFTIESFKKFIQMQTKLHDSVCERRNAATIATHDLDLLPLGDLTYTAMAPNAIKLRPLGRARDYTGVELFSHLQKEADDLRKEKKRNVYSGIHKYLHLLEGKPVYPCLLDSTERVISFPPITNSDITKMSVSSKSMLVEVTSSVNLSTCRAIADTLLRETLLLGISGETETQKANVYHTLTVEQVKIVDIEGNLKSVYPARNDLMFEGSHQITVLRK